MISLIGGEKYRLIGVQKNDTPTTKEGSVIECTGGYYNAGILHYKAKVVSSEVCGTKEGENITFTAECRLHAYCVPVGLGSRMLPDLKEGDYVIRTGEGNKAWRVTSDSLHWMQNGSMGNMQDMRYATSDEIERKIDTPLFNVGDIVVSKKRSGSLDEEFICRVSSISYNCIRSDDFVAKDASYAQDKFRKATPFEELAYKEGVHFLAPHKYKIERECMSRFPAPASFIDVGNNTFVNMDYDLPYWQGDKLMANGACMYYLGNWARPIGKEEKGDSMSDFATKIISDYNYRQAHPLSEHSAFFGLIDKDFSEIRGNGYLPIQTPKGFSQIEYDTNPMNQRMEVEVRREVKQPIHNNIIF